MVRFRIARAAAQKSRENFGGSLPAQKGLRDDVIQEASEKNLPDKEMLWRQYDMYIDLFKYYLDLVMKANALFYGTTGVILSFYFANFTSPFTRYALVLPIMMSLALARIFWYGTTLARFMQEDIFVLKDKLGLMANPHVQILAVTLRVSSIIFVLVGIALAILVLLK